MKRIVLSVVLGLFFLSAARATHIVGGEIMYKYLSSSGGNTNYRVTLYLFVDCRPGTEASISQDRDGSINVFQKNANGTYTRYTSKALTNARTGPIHVSDVKYNCILNKPDVCVDKYIYTVDVSVPNNSNGYIFSFERCCRTNSITNIVNPEQTGATYWTSVPAQSAYPVNSSPVFKSMPPNFLCQNAPFSFDHSATDEDGDSLVYDLCTPYTGASRNNPNPTGAQSTNPINFTNVNWLSGASYSQINQIDGSPGLSINRSSGKITLTPTLAGQFVIGIRVSEYRNGVKIGETRRDFQFNVSSCVFSVVSSMTAPSVNCSDARINFTNLSQGATRYHWDFGVAGTNADTSDLKVPNYAYQDKGSYTVTLIASTTVCSDTFQFDLDIKKSFKTVLPQDTLICGAFSKLLYTNQSDKTFKWSTGAVSPTITINSGGTYWVTVSDAPCSSSDTITVTNDKLKINLGPDTVLCADIFPVFVFRGVSGFSKYAWNDGTSLQTVKVDHEGLYIVNAVDNNNCTSSDSIYFISYHLPKPVLKDTMICQGSSALLDGLSQDAHTVNESVYTWSNGAATSAIRVSTAGTYTVTVKNKYCQASAKASVGVYLSNIELGADTFYCGQVERSFNVSDEYVQYVWDDFVGENTFTLRRPETLRLSVLSKEGCRFLDSVKISQYPVPDAALGNDTDVCVSTRVRLQANPAMVSYQWNTGASSSYIDVVDAGTYIVTVKDANACVISDSIDIYHNGTALPSEMYMPDAFTPNQDNLNETYPGNKYSDPGTSYRLKIFDRWGQQIFESQQPSMEWDGSIDGKEAPEAVYVFLVDYVGCDGLPRTFRGTFTLLR